MGREGPEDYNMELLKDQEEVIIPVYKITEGKEWEGGGSEEGEGIRIKCWKFPPRKFPCFCVL